MARTEPKPHNDMPGSTLTSDSGIEWAPSLTPGTSHHMCGRKSPPITPSSVVHTPGSKTSSPASSLAAESSQLTTPALTPSISPHTSTCSLTPRSRVPGTAGTGSSLDGELIYICKYLVQFLPAPTPKTKDSAIK